MKYSFGVPAWLGGIKVSLVIFGIPALVAILISPVLARRLELSRLAEMGVFAVSFLLTVITLLFILVARSRRASRKTKDHDDVA
jgi:hypothetical protein